MILIILSTDIIDIQLNIRTYIYTQYIMEPNISNKFISYKNKYQHITQRSLSWVTII